MFPDPRKSMLTIALELKFPLSSYPDCEFESPWKRFNFSCFLLEATLRRSNRIILQSKVYNLNLFVDGEGKTLT